MGANMRAVEASEQKQSHEDYVRDLDNRVNLADMLDVLNRLKGTRPDEPCQLRSLYDVTISKMTGAFLFFKANVIDKEVAGATEKSIESLNWEAKAEWLRMRGYYLNIDALDGEIDDPKWMASASGEGRRYGQTIQEVVEGVFKWVIEGPGETY